MTSKNDFRMLNLQLFAEGSGAVGAAGNDGGLAEGTGVTATAAVPQRKGAKSNPLANVKYGIQDAGETVPAAEVQQEEQPIDRNAEFEKLIKGDYKKQYDAKVQEIVQHRLKGSKEKTDKYDALTPTLEILAKKYGINDATDVEALNKAIQEDDSYFEEEAMKKGMTVEQFKQIRKMERENENLRQRMQEQQTRERADKLYASWLEQAESAKKVYPGFDLHNEMGNSKFLDLLKSNIDVRTAYEVVHKDEIIPAAMQFTAKTVEQKLANKVIANGARPSENGISSQGAALVKNDVSKLTKADRQEIIRRVQRGEKIRF